MQYLGIEYSIKNLPVLDAAFIPFGVWAKAYLKEASRPFKIAVERENGLVSVFETKLRGAEFAEANYRYAERYVKMLLWSVGGCKVDPYLRPLYDALFDMLGAETYQKYLERGNIEVAPLAYMRGRTLDDSFIILDEAQNTSREQMKMFLTRMGFGSKVVITGDITQIDLPGDKPSGLKEAMKVLKGVEGVSICQLGKADVVRHVMVQRIIEAYARFEEKKR